MADDGNDNGDSKFPDDISPEDVSWDADNLAKEFQDDISQQMQVHFSRLENDVQDVFQHRMETIESNLTNQLTEKVQSAQHSILKTNKVFREICRPLGSRWKELFTILTSNLPQDSVGSELNLIEKQSSLMQPYKCLMSWKDLKGTSFNVEELVPVLKSMGLNELAEKVESILYSDSNDELFSLSSIGRSQNPEEASNLTRTSVRNVQTSAKPATVHLSENKGPGCIISNIGDSSICGAAATPKVSESINRSKYHQSEESSVAQNTHESLADRYLLQLARKVSDCWDRLARALNVSKEDISEILTSEGTSNYQGAFRMLWIWRESRNDHDPDSSLAQLTSALSEIGRPDLITTLK